MDNIISYWLANYVTEHCTLCGNHGVIDTRGVRTPAGVFVGRLNYCICPNGQAMREGGADIEAYADAHMPRTLVHFGTPGARCAITEVPQNQCTCRAIDGKHHPNCPGSDDYWANLKPAKGTS